MRRRARLCPQPAKGPCGDGQQRIECAVDHQLGSTAHAAPHPTRCRRCRPAPAPPARAPPAGTTPVPGRRDRGGARGPGPPSRRPHIPPPAPRDAQARAPVARRCRRRSAVSAPRCPSRGGGAAQLPRPRCRQTSHTPALRRLQPPQRLRCPPARARFRRRRLDLPDFSDHRFALRTARRVDAGRCCWNPSLNGWGVRQPRLECSRSW